MGLFSYAHASEHPLGMDEEDMLIGFITNDSYKKEFQRTRSSTCDRILSKFIRYHDKDFTMNVIIPWTGNEYFVAEDVSADEYFFFRAKDSKELEILNHAEFDARLEDESKNLNNFLHNGIDGDNDCTLGRPI